MPVKTCAPGWVDDIQGIVVNGGRYDQTSGGIQAAVNDLPSAGGGILLAAGTYVISSAITLRSGVSIAGVGNASVILQRASSSVALNIFNDSSSAINNVIIRDVCFDNNLLVTTAHDIDLTGGCSDILVESCRWINLTNRTIDLTRIKTSATKGKRISWRDNLVVGPGSDTTWNSFQIFDCDNVGVRGNIIDGWGAIKLEGSLAAGLFGWNISGNLLKNVAQTNIFCRIQSASSVSDVAVCNNTIIDSGKAGIVVGAINAADTGTIDTVSVSGNSIRGFALSTADSAIPIGGNITSGTYYMTNVSVSGNSISGLDSTGAQPADQGRGIQIRAGVQGFSVTGNVVRDCGRDGITAVGCQNGVITGNRVERCVKQDTSSSAPTPAQEGGISVGPDSVYTCKNVIVSSNVCLNNGVSGSLISYGINLGPNYGGTITNIHTFGNLCFDSQSTATQDYGIIVGSAGNPGPDNSILWGNDVRNNKSGGITIKGTVSGTIKEQNVDTNSRMANGSFTVTAAGTTTVAASAIGSNSLPVCFPSNAAAGLLTQTKTCYIGTVADGSFTFLVSATGAGAPAGTETFNYFF